MYFEAVATFPDVNCYLIETSGDFTGDKLKAYNFVISGWVKPVQVLKRNSGYDSHDATYPSSFPHPPSDFCLSPILTRVWGYHNTKIVELKMFVGSFKAFWRFNALNYFLLKQKGKFHRPISSFLSSEDFRDAFCVAGGAFGRPWLQWIRRLTGIPRILQWRGSRRGGMTRGSCDVSPPVGSKGKTPVGVLWDEVPQKLKQSVKLVYNF